MLRKAFYVLVTLFVIFMPHERVYALNTSTHEVINLRVADSTLHGFSLDQYLRSNLDFSQGVGEMFNGEKVDQSCRLG